MSDSLAAPPQRRSQSGCFGLFCVLCLSIFTVGELGLLYWISPNWLERAEFWRGPVLPAEPDFSENPDAAAQIALQDAKPPKPPAEPAYVLLKDRAVHTSYDPARGATLATREGGSFHFPPGSLREAAEIMATPVGGLPLQRLDSNFISAGPGYFIKVAGQDHYQFARPVRVTLKIEPVLVQAAQYKTGDLSIGTFENGKWRTYPSRIDPATQTVSAEITHCSIIHLLGIPVLALLGTDTGRAIADNTIKDNALYIPSLFEPVYKTEHFSLHYSRRPGYAVPGDSDPVPFPSGFAEQLDAPHPNFVVLMGRYLEYSHAHLAAVGMHPRDRWFFNHAIYFIPMASLGETSASGRPISFSNNWQSEGGGGYPGNVINLMKATATHELIHGIQPQSFSRASGQANPWFIEMSAAYLADYFWEQQSEPTDMIGSYYMKNDSGKMLTLPIDRAESNDAYRYGIFLKWLETLGAGKSLKVLEIVRKSGDPSLKSFADACKAECGKPLGELLELFAQEYYHNDVWKSQMIPSSVYGGTRRSRASIQSNAKSDKFTFVGRVASEGGPVGALQIYEEEIVPPVQHLCVLAYPIHADVIPATRKAKLIVAFEPSGGKADPNLHLSAAAGNASQSGRATVPFGDLTQSKGGKSVYIFKDFATPGNNRLTLLLANRSLTDAAQGGRLQRWVLMPPTWVQFERKAGGGAGAPGNDWNITWEHSELCASEAFASYKIYRRKLGEPDSALTLIHELKSPAEKYTDKAPDAEDYAYTITVVDKLDNESAKAPIEVSDPFQGTWSGKIKLLEGSIIDPLIQGIEKTAAESDKKEAERIAKLNPDERASSIKAWNENKKKAKEFWDEIVPIGKKFEQAFRIGLPCKMQLRRTEGRYYFSMTHMLLQQVDSEEIELKRTGQYTLKFPPVEKMPPLFLRLHRTGKDSEIRTKDDEWGMEETIDGTKIKYKLGWSFKRTSDAPPPAPKKKLPQSY